MNQKLEAAKQLFANLPRADLGFFPTPFYKLENLSAQLGINLFIKRDDFTGTNLFGGNKIRKLEYLLGQAKAQGCEYVITYGATQSNHAMETASACRKCNIKPILYLTAVVKPDDKDIRANLLLDKILGAEIHIIDIEEGETAKDAEDRSLQIGAAQAAALTASGHKCYDIPIGGASPVGSTGFARGYLELQEQLDANNIHADYLFHATGSGGTLAGLVAGHKLVDSHTRIISIAVGKKDPAQYLLKVAGLANAVLEDLHSPLTVDPEKDFHVDASYYLPGYEQPNEAASNAIRTLAQTEGLFVDPVYTGKALAGLIDYAASGKIPKGSNVVFWHTGGATALFAEPSILGTLF